MQLRNATRWLTAGAPVTQNVSKTTRFISPPLPATCNQIVSTAVKRSIFMASTKACQSAKASRPYTNQLIHSKSPYLLQHAHNPVSWYPWGEEAFQKAKEEKKLIFLSVGYSTCHWCHVMEKECFENPTIAELMNQNYINIKVDREERPDVDKMYMNFIQAISGQGGWPMSVWLTPDLRPVFGGTYFPPDDRYNGRPGFGTILKSLVAQWKDNPGKFVQSGEQIVTILSDSVALKDLGDIPSATECSTLCFQQLQNSYEPNYGGFSKTPKFPQPVNLQFLLKHHLRSRSDLETTSQSLEMCLHTLRMMAKGGIHDHVSKGFARYSTDEKWHVPHFEKMLYDQAQLAALYSEAYLVTKDESFACVVRDIFAYVEECLSDPSGGFYSAEDADSYPVTGVKEKKEGAFYVWTYEEIQSLLSDTAAGENFSLADIVCHHFDIRPNGNVEPHQDPHDELKRQNVLIIRASREETADKFGLAGGVDALDRLLSRALAIMKQARDKRPRPHLDDKMLASWNGLMISALAKAGAILNEKAFIDRAIKTARFMRAHLYDPDSGRLLRSCYRSSSDDGPSQNPVPIEGFLDDYAFTIGGLLDLFNVCQDERWLQWADQLQRKQDQLFWDAEPTSGAYFTSAQGDANLLVRSKEDQDGAEPSGNSVSVSNLVRLSLLLDCAEYRHKAGRILQLFHQRLSRVPVALPAMVSALIMYQDSPTEVIVVGPSDSETAAQLMDEALGHVTSLLGQLVVRFDPSDEQQRNGYVANRRGELLQMKSSPPAAYLCRHRSCSAPVGSAADLRRLLDR